MGLFKKKSIDPMPVGQALCLLDADGWGYANQQHHQNMDPDAIAMLAPITFVIDEATRLQPRGRQHVDRWLAAARRAATDGPDAVNRAVNPGGVVPLEEVGAAAPRGVGAWGSFFITPTNKLVGSWQPIDDYRGDSHRARVLGVLLAAAEWRNVLGSLPHAFEALATDAVNYNDPQARAELPQLALDYGVHQAALDDYARSLPPTDPEPPF